MFDVHLHDVGRKIVAEPFVNNETQAVRVLFVIGPCGIDKGPRGFRINNFVVGPADHENCAGEHFLYVKDWIDFRQERFRFRPQAVGLSPPQLVGMPALEPLVIRAGANESDDGREPWFLRCDSQPRYAGGGTTNPADFSDVAALQKVVNDATGVFDCVKAAFDVAVGEPLVEVKPLRAARGIGVRCAPRSALKATSM